MPAWLLIAVATTAAGVVASAGIVTRLAFSERLALGAALGVAFWRWAPWIASCAVGIESGAQVALVAAAVLALAGLARRSMRAPLVAEASAALAALRRERGARARLAVFTLFAALVAFLSCRYYLPERPDGYYGMGVLHDLAVHVMYVNDFRWCLDVGPFEQPNFPGVGLGYHFLSDASTAATVALGSTLAASLRAAAVVALTTAFVLAFHLLRRWLASDAKAWTALALAFLGGGLGFVLWRRAFTPGALPWIDATYDYEKFLYYGELLVDVLLPARAAQSGFPVALAALLLLDRGCDRANGTATEVLAGSALIGLLPLVHAHSALAATIIALGWTITRRPPVARALGGAALAVALGLPQALWLHAQRQGYARGAHLQLFWVAHDLRYSPLVLWLWCLGPFLALTALGAFAASRSQRLAVAPLVALFVIGNVVSFTPISFDNIKVFMYFQLGGAVLATEALGYVWARGRAGWVAAALLLALTTLSGALAIVAAAARPLVLFIPRRDIEIGEFVRSVTDPDDVLLTAALQTHPAIMFAGRRVVLGDRQCLTEDGVDVRARTAAVKAIFENRRGAADLLRELEVDWIVVGETERQEFPALDEKFFERLAIETLHFEDTTLYRVR